EWKSSTPAARLQDVEAGVGRNLVQPGPRRLARLELIEPLPCSRQALLRDVLGILQRSEHPITMEGDRAPVRLEVRLKLLIPRAAANGPARMMPRAGNVAHG